MNRDGGVNERIYAQLKSTLLSGAISVHARLDFAELAGLYQVSTTPVREAVMRLLGEGLLENHPKGGVRPAFTSEVGLRALLDLHSRFATLALDWGSRAFEATNLELEEMPVEFRTRRVFVALARTTGNAEFSRIVDGLNDRLTPFRHLEHHLLVGLDEELADLILSIEQGSAKRALRAYHRRREKIVAQLVWMSASDPEQH